MDLLIESILRHEEDEKPWSYQISISKLRKVYNEETGKKEDRGIVRAVIAHNEEEGYKILKGSIIANFPTSVKGCPGVVELWNKMKKNGYISGTLITEDYLFGHISKTFIANFVVLAARNNGQAFSPIGNKQNFGIAPFLKALGAIKELNNN